MVTKKELVAIASGRTPYTKETVRIVLNAIIDSIVESVAHGQDVRIQGFMSVLVKKYKEKEVEDRFHGRWVRVPEHYVVKIMPNDLLRDAIDYLNEKEGRVSEVFEKEEK